MFILFFALCSLDKKKVQAIISRRKTIIRQQSNRRSVAISQNCNGQDGIPKRSRDVSSASQMIPEITVDVIINREER